MVMAANPMSTSKNRVKAARMRIPATVRSWYALKGSGPSGAAPGASCGDRSSSRSSLRASISASP
jgi:hypothetical protein